MNLSKKAINHIVYCITLLVSILYIVIGNQICKTTLYDESIHSLQTESGTVTKILDVQHNEFSLGGETKDSIVTEKKIFFESYVKKLDKHVIATQTLDSMHPVSPKDVEEGDQVLLSNVSSVGGSEESEWVFAEYKRSNALIGLAIVFLVLVVLFGRKKGVNTIISLAFTCLAIFAVFVPSILSGFNIYTASIITCLYIIFMTLLIINGIGKKTFCSIVGCLGGLFVTGVLTVIMDNILNLTGAIDEDAVFLLLLNESNPIDLRAIIFGAIIIGALGATMDISLSIASSLQEVSDNMMNRSFHSLVKSGFNIGRDMIGTMANTLILAYIGSSLTIVLLLVANAGSLLNLFNREMIVVEIMQALVGSLGILFTIPITSILSAYVYSRKPKQKTDLSIVTIDKINTVAQENISQNN